MAALLRFQRVTQVLSKPVVQNNNERNADNTMRTQIPEMTGERLTAKMSVWMLSAAQGNEQPIDRLETSIDVLRMVGFNQDIISDLVRKAASAASLPVDDAVERFAPEPEQKAKRQRGRKPATG